MLQVGARNMQNFNLLNAVGEQRKPVLLKRGMSATLEEFLLAAEYIMAQGQHAGDALRARASARTRNTSATRWRWRPCRSCTA